MTKTQKRPATAPRTVATKPLLGAISAADFGELRRQKVKKLQRLKSKFVAEAEFCVKDNLKWDIFHHLTNMRS